MKRFFYILVLYILFGCNMSKEFDAELPEAPKILGMYCLFSPDSVWKIQVFKPGNITDDEFNNSQLFINDAEVKLYCNNQFQERLINIGNGIYISNENNKPVSGNTYYIEILKDSFPNIVSDTASILSKLQLDSIFLLNNPQLNLFSTSGIEEYEEDMQLNIYFKNEKNYPFIIDYAGIAADYIYSTYELTGTTVFKKKDRQSVENEMLFYRCYHEETCSQSDDFNILKLTYISNAYFEFSKGEDIQDDASHSIINYYPGNINSNIKNGLGLFAPVNYIKINIDTIEIR